MAKEPPRPRVAVTLSQEALEVYTALAKEFHLPLPTYLRQSLEAGVPAMKMLLKAAQESDPQTKLTLAKGIQLQAIESAMNLEEDADTD